MDFSMVPSTLLVFAWARVRLAHMYSLHSPANSHCHAENLRNECADHATALGAFGLVSNHNLYTRWTRHTFDSASRFATCHNLGEVLENYVILEWSRPLLPNAKPGDSVSFLTVLQCEFSVHFTVFPCCFTVWYWIKSVSLSCTIVRSNASSASTVSSPDDLIEQNMWNTMMELLLHVHVGNIFVLHVDETDLAKLALSCHFAFGLLCDKTGSLIPRNGVSGTIAREMTRR